MTDPTPEEMRAIPIAFGWIQPAPETMPSSRRTDMPPISPIKNERERSDK